MRTREIIIIAFVALLLIMGALFFNEMQKNALKDKIIRRLLELFTH
jgi:hypothetical protein